MNTIEATTTLAALALFSILILASTNQTTHKMEKRLELSKNRVEHTDCKTKINYFYAHQGGEYKNKINCKKEIHSSLPLIAEKTIITETENGEKILVETEEHYT